MSKTRKQSARPMPAKQPQAAAPPAPDHAAPAGSGYAFLQQHSWVHYLVLALVAVALYAQTAGFDYTLDDPISTTKNRFVQQGFSGIGTLMTHGYMYGENLDNSGAYRPLPLATFAIENEFVGNSPGFSHIVNILLYACCAVVLYKMLRVWLRDYHFLLPFAAVLLWVAHPIHTEVAASIKSRDELMSMLFAGLSGLAVFRYYDARNPLQLALAALWLLLGLMCKENAITFVAVIPLALYFFRPLPLKQIALAVVPLVVATGIYLAMRAAFLDGVVASAHAASAADNTLAAAGSTAERLATAFVILLRYIWLLIFPHPLSYDYSYNQIPIVGLTDVQALLGIAVYAGLLVFALLKLKSKHLISFCILYFMATISIVSNLVVDIGATLGERFLFMPSVAFCLALAWGIGKVFSADWQNFRIKPVPVMAVVLVISLLYSVKTVARTADWQDNITLFESGVHTSPNSARTNFHYGYQLFKKADRVPQQAEKDRLYHEASRYLTRAVEIFPAIRDAQRNLGLVSVNLRQYDKAARHLQVALRMNDTLALANFYTGVAMTFTNRPDSALLFFERELQLNPNHALSHHYKGSLLYDLTERHPDPAQRDAYLQQSLLHLTRAIELNPSYADSHFQRGYALGKAGDFRNAVESLERGIALQPGNTQALLFIGIGYGILGQPEKAVPHLQQAVAKDPKMVEAYRNLAFALRDTGRRQEAIQYLQQGLQHNPGDPQLQALLGQM